MNNPKSSTTSLDLPPQLQGLLNMSPAAPVPPTQSQAMPMTAGLSSAMTGQRGFIPSYEAGGMIGPQGMPMPTAPMGKPGVAEGMPAQGGMDPQMLEMQLNQFVRQNPQQIQQIRNAIMQEVQSGGLTMDELNMVVQLATVAAQNPAMYPNVRQYAIQQGIATEADLPQQFDAGLVFVLLLAARAIQQEMGGQGAQGPAAIPSMARGGQVPNSKSDSGEVLIMAHEKEYVIPRNVVEMKGKEFFDNLVEKYRKA